MIFGVVILLVILGIAFFHFVQGFFSATLSAIIAIISAAVALGYHESLVYMFKPGKFADSAHAWLICILYVVTYSVLRILFDKLVPGNVRVQSTIDKVGGGLMGLIAGTMAGGILAIGAQLMPFGPGIAGYSRYALVDPPRDVQVSIVQGGTSLDRTVYDEMQSDTFKDSDLKPMINHADEMVVSLVSTLSDGSLSRDHRFSSVHPDFLQEAFGNRIGIESGAKRTATNFDNQNQVTVEALFVPARLSTGLDAEVPEIRQGKAAKKPAADVLPKPQPDLVPTPPQTLFIVRAKFSLDATDKDHVFRFTSASARLVTSANGKSKNYYPIGTLDLNSSGVFQYWHNRIDDTIFIKVDDANGADLVYLIDDRDEIFDNTAPAETPKKGKTAAEFKVKDGVFIEIKRLGRVDLSGQSADTGQIPKDPKIEVMRKVRLKKPPAEPTP